MGTDKTPPGKRIGLCLRDKEKVIEKDIQDGIDGKKADPEQRLMGIQDLYLRIGLDMFIILKQLIELLREFIRRSTKKKQRKLKKIIENRWLFGISQYTI